MSCQILNTERISEELAATAILKLPVQPGLVFILL